MSSMVQLSTAYPTCETLIAVGESCTQATREECAKEITIANCGLTELIYFSGSFARVQMKEPGQLFA